MESKNIIAELRSQKGFSQDELAEKVFVAISKFEILEKQ